MLNPCLLSQLNQNEPLDRARTTLVSMVQGNHYNVIGLVQDGAQFDFVLPGREDLPVLPGAQIILYGAVRDTIVNEMKELAALLRRLTEGWYSKEDGAVFAISPGCGAGSHDSSKHAFVNFSVGEVTEDLREAIRFLRARNPSARVLLTVSPVPLIATYEPQHVLVSTTYSKSVLRVAAETLKNELENVDYYPSYEIITGNFSGGAYYEGDLREVREEGVRHAMTCFFRHYLGIEIAVPAEK